MTFYVLVSDHTSNPNKFVWWTSATESAQSSPANMSSSPIELSYGVKISFDSVTGHGANQMWELKASTPTISILEGRSRQLEASGGSASTAGTYIVTINDGLATPNTFSYAVDGGTSVGPTDIILGGQAIGSSAITLFWSHDTGYVAGTEWTIILDAGGAAVTIPRPVAPLVAEWTGFSQASFTFVVSITSEAVPNQFTFSVNGKDNGADYDIAPYSTGNGELGELRLRFYNTTGFKIG